MCFFKVVLQDKNMINSLVSDKIVA